MPQNIADFLPVKADILMILLAVHDRPEHGYAIMKNVEHRTGGSMMLQTGALYRALKRLLDDGLILECDAPDGEEDTDERRRFYRTTKLGAAVIDAEIERMAAIVRTARSKRTPQMKKRPGLA